MLVFRPPEAGSRTPEALNRRLAECEADRSRERVPERVESRLAVSVHGDCSTEVPNEPGADVRIDVRASPARKSRDQVAPDETRKRNELSVPNAMPGRSRDLVTADPAVRFDRDLPRNDCSAAYAESDRMGLRGRGGRCTRDQGDN